MVDSGVQIYIFLNFSPRTLSIIEIGLLKSLPVIVDLFMYLLQFHPFLLQVF